MKRRVPVDQRAAPEDARRLLRERLGEPRDERLRHDLIADVPDRGHPRGHEQREDLVARHLARIQDVHQVDMGVDQARDEELPLRRDRRGSGRRLDGVLGRPDGADLPSVEDHRPIREHPPAGDVQHRAAADHHGTGAFLGPAPAGAGPRTARAINADQDERFMRRGLLPSIDL